MNKKPSICVYCGSRVGDKDIFVKNAENLGRRLAINGNRLVFGAGSIGLMGAVSKAAIEEGGEVIGVIPHHLDAVEITQTGLAETIRVETMHERKKIMFDRSDAFVILPGGLGTMDETFEVLTWTQLGLHNKPILVFNIDDFWKPLYDFVWTMVARGFVDEKTATKLVFLKNIDEIMAHLSNIDMPSTEESLSDLF